MIHRLVVLPDYQGIGIGIQLLGKVAEHYKQNKYDVRIVTSTPALIHSLKRNGWKLLNYGRQTGAHEGISGLNKTLSNRRNTYRFKYTGLTN